jgi:hypothetical protein
MNNYATVILIFNRKISNYFTERACGGRFCETANGKYANFFTEVARKGEFCVTGNQENTEFFHRSGSHKGVL